jgi:ribulose-5-phosphate 4-epimerase/fuculose-1-phosphate aldolase
MVTASMPSAAASEERQLRRELAAAYRLAAHQGWDDQIATHFSARLSDGTFLLNPLGLLFEEITASSLIRVDMDGRVLSSGDLAMNPAAFTIHSAVLAARPDVHCVMHLHTRDGTAVSALAEGLLPLTQTAMIVRQDITYHDFEGIANDLDERTRLQRDIGGKNLMILRNHGTLTVGATIAKAFYRMDFLEMACAMQVRALGMGRDVTLPDPAVQDHVATQSAIVFSDAVADAHYWPAMLRKAERLFPGFDD